MKKSIKLFSILCVAVMLAACSSSQQVTVTGIPGTEIYNNRTEFQHLGTIGVDGKAYLKLPKTEYDAFLFYHPEGSNAYIPFAVDYYYNNQNWKHWTAVLSIPTGIFIAPAFLSAMNSGIQLDYKFKYQSFQNTNQDLTFTDYVNSGFKREIGGSSKTYFPDANDTPVSRNDVSASSKAKSRTSKANKTLNDYGRQLGGTYIGTGKLIFKDEVIESYKNMKVVLTRVDKNNVMVQVFEGSGESFFSAGNKYGIKKGRDGFSLTLQGIPSAVITVNGKGSLAYCHPKVNIDGEIYTLEISASKR